MNNNRNSILPAICLIISLLALAIAGFSLGGRTDGPKPITAAGTEAVYNRVVANRTIRAAYTVYPPSCIKDANSGKLSGIFVDALEEVGRRLDMKIEWTEEVGFGNAIEGLQSDRYDILGSGLWQNATRGKVAYFSTPLYFNALRIWTRANETRFKSLADLNAAEVRISVQDGAMEDIIAKSEFPNSKRVSIPQLTQWSDVLLNITSGKADLTFAEPGVVEPFLKIHPGTLKEFQIGRPIRVFPAAFALKMGENRFKSIIDSAVEEIINDGTMDRILKKYETASNDQLRVAPPYSFK